MKGVIKMMMATAEPVQIIRALEQRFPPAHLRSLPRAADAPPAAPSGSYPEHWTPDAVCVRVRMLRVLCCVFFFVQLRLLLHAEVGFFCSSFFVAAHVDVIVVSHSDTRCSL